MDGVQGRLNAVVLGLGRHYHDLLQLLEGRLFFVLNHLKSLDQLLLQLLQLLSLLFKFIN